MSDTENIKLHPRSSKFYEILGGDLLEKGKEKEALRAYCFAFRYNSTKTGYILSEITKLIQKLNNRSDVEDIVVFLFASIHENPLNGYFYYVASVFLRFLGENEHDCLEVSGFCVPDSIIERYYPKNNKYAWDKSEKNVHQVKDGSFFCLNYHQILWSETHKKLIKNTSFGTPHLLVGSPWLRDKCIHLQGKVLALSVRHPVNYYHWVIDILCRACFVLDDYRELSQLDYVLVDTLQSDFQVKSLATLGIEKKKVLQSIQTPYITADLIVCPSHFYAVDPYQRQSAIQKIRNLFIPDINSQNSKANRRIYITRQDATARKVCNENDVINLLKQFDFEIHTMQGKTIQQQAELFSSASVVVSPHGAALTNLIFCKKDVCILKICSDTYCLDYMKSLAEDVNLEFQRLVIPQRNEVAKNLIEESRIKFNLMERSKFDMVIDLKLLENKLGEIL